MLALTPAEGCEMAPQCGEGLLDRATVVGRHSIRGAHVSPQRHERGVGLFYRESRSSEKRFSADHMIAVLRRQECAAGLRDDLGSTKMRPQHAWVDQRKNPK